eukprot:m.236155 g.236155  ORF g.236155 m.236155 type:complete len:215 (-) comp15772_c0_seq3:376-1020(-)
MPKQTAATIGAQTIVSETPASAMAGSWNDCGDKVAVVAVRSRVGRGVQERFNGRADVAEMGVVDAAERGVEVSGVGLAVLAAGGVHTPGAAVGASDRATVGLTGGEAEGVSVGEATGLAVGVDAGVGFDIGAPEGATNVSDEGRINVVVVCVEVVDNRDWLRTARHDDRLIEPTCSRQTRLPQAQPHPQAVAVRGGQSRASTTRSREAHSKCCC